MKGKYHLIVQDKKLCFDLWLERNITVIKGNSGTGKTTLYLYLSRAKSKITGGVHCNLSDKIRLLSQNEEDWEYILKTTSGKIIVADETVTGYIQTKEFAKYVNNSDNYFLFITRSGRLRHLSYSTKCVYELESERREKVVFTSMHNRYLEDNKIIYPDLVITEDKCSGFQMFSGILNCKVILAEGKDKVDITISKNIGKYKSICAVVDGSAFGSLVELVCRRYSDYENITIFAPESFEYLLLNSNPFLRLAKDEILKAYDYCDSTQYLSWERYYTDLLKKLCRERYKTDYSKSKLPKVFKNGEYMDVIKDQLTIHSSVYRNPEDVFK